MARQEFWVGSVGPLLYDDTETYPDLVSRVALRGLQVHLADAPAESEQALRLGDISSLVLGGSDKQVQFNDNGAFGGDADFTYDKATDILYVGGQLGIGTDSPATELCVEGTTRLGGATDYLNVSSSGFVTLLAGAKCKLSMRPQLYAGRVGGVAKPTFVTLGAYGGYSFPIFAADDEELFFREVLPGRWDGASDIKAYIVCCLASAETVGEEFAFQLSWANKVPTSGVLTSGTTDVVVQQELVTDRAAQYSIYKLEFTIDWDGPTPDCAAGDLFSGRIRRIAVTGVGTDEVDGEVILLDFYLTYTVDRMFKAA